MKKLPGKPVRKKHNAGKALKISALFGIVLLLIIASVNIFSTRETTPERAFVLSGGEDSGTTNTQTVNTVSVITIASPGKGGSITPSASIPQGTSITLNAQPAEGYRFVGWREGSSANYVSNSPSFVTPVLNADTSYTADFVLQSTVEVVPKTLIIGSDNKPVESTEGGIVIGGGTLSDGEILNVQAIPSNEDLYEFVDWYILDDQGYHAKGIGNDRAITVGYETSTARLNLEQGERLFAAFKRKSNKVLVTATMIPAIFPMIFRHSEISEDAATALRNHDNISSTISTVLEIGEYQNLIFVYFGGKVNPDTTSHGMETQYDDDGKNTGVATHTQYSLENVTFRNSQGVGNLSTHSPHSVQGAFASYGGQNAQIQGDTDIFIHFSGYDTSFHNTCSLSTVAFPSEGGVTTGDMASSGSFSTTIRATPNDGYMFDHWEWYDPDNGEFRSSKEVSVSIGVTGFITCKAFFRKAAYSVNVASISPGAGGYVKKGLGTYQGKSNVEVEIVPYEGYEFQSVSYTTMDGITHSHDSSSFTIENITEDIFLNIVFKQTKFTVSAKPDPVGANASANTYNKVKLTSGDMPPLETDSDGTAVEVELNSQGSVTLEAFPNYEDGYRFSEWVGTDGTVSAANPFTPSSVTKDVTYIAKFEKDKYKIRVIADPVGFGTVSVAATDQETSVSSEIEVDNNGEAYIKAEPSAGYEFLYWTNSAGTRLTSSEIKLENIRNDETYTAHFGGIYELTIEPSPSGYGQVELGNNGYVTGSTTYRVPGGEVFILSAKPLDNSSYRFVKWVWKEGTEERESRNSQISIETGPNSSGDLISTYTAVFAENSVTVRTVADPVIGGMANVYGKNDPRVDSQGNPIQQTEISAAIGESIHLAAIPAAGYQFLYWSSSSGTIYKDAEFDVSDIGNDEVFTAHFGGPLELTIEPSPSGYGQVQLNNNGYVTNSTTYHVMQGETVQLSAKPLDNSSYKFVKWVGSDGSEYRSPNITVDITQRVTYSAVFAENSFTVRTIADPETGGTANVYGPGDDQSVQQTIIGANTGDEITLIARPYTDSGYKFLYWTSSTGTRYYDATTVISDIGNDEVFTAHFYKDTIKVTVNGTPKGSSVFKLNDDDLNQNSEYVSEQKVYDVKGNSNITLTSEPTDASKFEFVAWEDNYGNTYQVNPLQITEITKDTTFTAIYNPKDQEVGIVLRASPANGGILTKVLSDDGAGGVKATITAQANPGFTFFHWIRGSLIIEDAGSTYTFTNVQDGEIYTAVFKEDPNYKPTSDIPSQKFPEVSRTESSPSYTVTRETMSIKAKKQVDRAASRYKDYSGIPNSYSAYSSIIAETSGKYAEVNDRSALLLADEFITTQKQTVSSVPASLQNAQEYAAQFTKGKFGDRYKFEILTIKQVTADADFASSEHTYLLKNTGAAFKDNVYILFGTPGGRGRNSGIQGFDWVTCFVDEAGTLRFTIRSFHTNDYFIVVRTWPE